MGDDADLVEAVVAGDVEAVRRALERGADPNASESGKRGRPALIIAAMEGGGEIARLLLDAGASPDVVTGWDYTPLRAAALAGHADVVLLLLERGANPNSGHKRRSILEEVAMGTSPPSPSFLAGFRALLAAGATVRPHEEPVIVTAVSHRADPSMLRLLLAQGEHANGRRSEDTPVLIIAARRNKPAAVDVLLEAGADVNASDPAGRTALMYAVERDNGAVARILLFHGADPGLRAPDGTTALQLAQAGHRNLMQFMLGVRHAQRRDVPAARTVVELRPTRFELRGSPDLFDLWARCIEHTLSGLGESEFEVIVTGVATARRFIHRLRHEPRKASEDASWHSLTADAAEVHVMAGCLNALWGGPRMEMPEGLSKIDMNDLLTDLDSQLYRD